MTEPTTAPPDRLRQRIAKTIAPTRPLLSPRARVLIVAPLALATVVAVPALNALRPDVAELGVLRTWGLSLLEAAVGLGIVGLALRESIPGRALSRAVVVGAVVIGVALPIAIYLLTAERFDIGVGPRAKWLAIGMCFRTSVAAAVPALVAATILVARAFPLRPVVAGALYGLGCGVIADAGLRLFCDFTMPSHVLTAHGGAVVASMLAGCVVASTTQRTRSRER